jgi:hypothetical protein
MEGNSQALSSGRLEEEILKIEAERVFAGW